MNKGNSKKASATSRLIVKNLPVHLTEARLKEHFSKQGGQITDVKIIKAENGRSRKFGFVGFANIKDAKHARGYFDGTYIDTSKISVDYAKQLGDSSIPRPWSKYSEGSSKNLQLKESEEKQGKKRKDLFDDNDDSEEDKEIKDAMHNPKRKKGPVDLYKIADTGRLFLRNLSFMTTENDLRKLFSRFGTLNEVHISADKETKKSKGFGFVTFMFPHDAVEAQKALDGTIFQGRLLHILASDEPVEKKNEENKNENGEFLSEYQQRKLEKLKSLSEKDYNWNTLFIRPDSIAQAMANNLNVDKSQILDHESKESLAVRLALGETNIIKETKQFLEQEGISLEALKGHYNKDIERSENTIIVKNISPSTQIEELKSLFGKYGSLGRVVMPPSRTMALVEFFVNSEAKTAFRSLAYKKFKDVPLFLEWAPIGVFKQSHIGLTLEKGEENKKDIEEEEDEEEDKKIAPLMDLDEPEVHNRTLYVKNLNFSTTEESLTKLVESIVGKVNNVSIAKHRVKDEMLSQGFGFIEFVSREQAMKAWKKMNGSLLDGHQLQLSFSRKRIESDPSAKRKKVNVGTSSCKINVKNIAFQASKKELRELFQQFGELKSIRLPTKPGGKGHRGFAFVEYISKDDAANAMEALGNTRLYGRRFVMEYALDDSIEGLSEE